MTFSVNRIINFKHIYLDQKLDLKKHKWLAAKGDKISPHFYRPLKTPIQTLMKMFGGSSYLYTSQFVVTHKMANQFKNDAKLGKIMILDSYTVYLIQVQVFLRDLDLPRSRFVARGSRGPLLLVWVLQRWRALPTQQKLLH